MGKEFVTVKGKKYFAEDGVLDLSNRRITDIKEIKGLEHLTNLQTLILSNNRIREIKGLENLNNLKELNLENNWIIEITGLENLINLQELYLADNEIEMIEGMENVKNLKILSLSTNKIKVIEGLEHLINLQELYLNGPDYWSAEVGKGNFITEIKGLENLAYLQRLDLGENQIKDIKGLEHLTNLKELNLYGNQIQKIKGLDTLVMLRELNLHNNQIKELEGLTNIKNLQNLYLNNNCIFEIKGLENLKNLQELDLSANPIRNDEMSVIYTTIRDEYIPEWNDMSQNYSIGIEKPLPDDMRDVQEVVKYCREKKSGNNYVTFRGENYYVLFDTLDLSEKEITDIYEIKGLDNLTKLKELRLSNNQLEEIKGLESLKDLQYLDLKGNPIRFDEPQIVDMNAQEIVRYCQDKTEERIPFVTVKGDKYYTMGKLDLSQLKIADIREIKGLDTLSNLQELNIRGNQISEICGLEKLTQLKKLDLTGNPLRKDQKHLAAQGLKQAQKVVEHCQDKIKVEFDVFVTIKGEKYYVSNNILDLSEIGLSDIIEIRGLENLTQLKILYLNGNQIEKLTVLEHLTNLRELYFSNNQIEEVKGLERLTCLESLDLSDNQIKDIRGLDTLINLKKLYLRGNLIEEIKGLENLNNLRRLNLTDNPIQEDEQYLGDSGYLNAPYVVKFCQIKMRKLPAVMVRGKVVEVKNRRLNLSWMDIRDITEITGLDNLAELEVLILSFNKIREIKGLDNITNLKELYLHDNLIEEIKGLENLVNLQVLFLWNNLLNEVERELVENLSTQELVKYCQEKIRN